MPRRTRRPFPGFACPFVVWCLLVAMPVFAVSSALVQLLGANHFHATVATSSSHADARAMQAWDDTTVVATTKPTPSVHGHGHAHAHAQLDRHHHDHDDASVVALDGGLTGDTSDEGGTSEGSSSHVMALTDLASARFPSVSGVAWLDAVDAAAMRWAADGPMRPPKA